MYTVIYTPYSPSLSNPRLLSMVPKLDFYIIDLGSFSKLHFDEVSLFQYAKVKWCIYYIYMGSSQAISNNIAPQPRIFIALGLRPHDIWKPPVLQKKSKTCEQNLLMWVTKKYGNSVHEISRLKKSFETLWWDFMKLYHKVSWKFWRKFHRKFSIPSLGGGGVLSFLNSIPSILLISPNLLSK